MNTFKPFAATITLVCISCFAGCSSTPKSPAVADAIRHALDQSGYKNVSVSQDREKGVVTLTGNVAADTDKANAQSIAQGIAGAQVVADEIQVLAPGNESATKDVNADLDDGISKNLEAVFIQDNFKRDVSFDVKNGVVTLKGTVASQARRAKAEKVATGVPNVAQVVNELQVKGQKATSTQMR